MRISKPTVICIIFSLLLSISKHNNLHFSSYDFIIVAKPSLVTLFFMFHVIMITIFIGSSKPLVENLECSFSSLTPPRYEMDQTIQKVEVCRSTSTDDEDDDQSYNISDIGYHDDSYHGSDEYDEENDDDGIDTEGKDSEDEEYDNKLENKIEEFIEKVYQKRREEFLGDRLSLYNCWLASLANWSASQALDMHKWKTCNKG
ncbi:hypothetical protein H0E87_004880 [Populus deltoides]|uniref:Uncharacterized protein n=1 Tax=Populus deltoides TaxID=3696 RepID=A0A8T2ZHD2_POPDE|nr:hypothetical protein H0E87_004880 [Populus deltoides]